MAFVNRAIQAQDRYLYQLDSAESSMPVGVLTPNTYWVVDDIRRIYLREVWFSNRGPEPDPDPISLAYRFHYFVDGRLYLLSMTHHLKQRTLHKVDKQRDISEFWTLTRIEPLDEFARCNAFFDTLKEAMQACQGDSYIANFATQNGWDTHYKLNLVLDIGG